MFELPECVKMSRPGSQDRWKKDGIFLPDKGKIWLPYGSVFFRVGIYKIRQRVGPVSENEGI